VYLFEDKTLTTALANEGGRRIDLQASRIRSCLLSSWELLTKKTADYQYHWKFCKISPISIAALLYKSEKKEKFVESKLMES
jgi:hypothetical protein